VTATLDALGSVPPGERGGLDVMLLAMTSICLLGEQFALSA
jgi:hypothetical protein